MGPLTRRGRGRQGWRPLEMSIKKRERRRRRRGRKEKEWRGKE
jgi:hypothetical protein